jgi:hypothetical protein
MSIALSGLTMRRLPSIAERKPGANRSANGVRAHTPEIEGAEERCVCAFAPFWHPNGRCFFRTVHAHRVGQEAPL